VIRQIPREALVTVERVGQGLAVAHQLLRLGRVVPEVRVLGHRVQFLEPMLGGLPAETLAQEGERSLDLFDDAFGLGAHGGPLR